jgi:hypothetical protein
MNLFLFHSFHFYLNDDTEERVKVDSHRNTDEDIRIRKIKKAIRKKTRNRLPELCKPDGKRNTGHPRKRWTD